MVWNCVWLPWGYLLCQGFHVCQVLCVRDEEAVQKDRDSTWEFWTVPVMIKAVEGGSRGLFTSTSELEQKAIDQLKSCCGFWISSNLWSLFWNLCESQIWRDPRPIRILGWPVLGKPHTRFVSWRSLQTAKNWRSKPLFLARVLTPSLSNTFPTVASSREEPGLPKADVELSEAQK